MPWVSEPAAPSPENIPVGAEFGTELLPGPGPGSVTA